MFPASTILFVTVGRGTKGDLGKKSSCDETPLKVIVYLDFAFQYTGWFFRWLVDFKQKRTPLPLYYLDLLIRWFFKMKHIPQMLVQQMVRYKYLPWVEVVKNASKGDV